MQTVGYCDRITGELPGEGMGANIRLAHERGEFERTCEELGLDPAKTGAPVTIVSDEVNGEFHCAVLMEMMEEDWYSAQYTKDPERKIYVLSESGAGYWTLAEQFAALAYAAIDVYGRFYGRGSDPSISSLRTGGARDFIIGLFELHEAWLSEPAVHAEMEWTEVQSAISDVEEMMDEEDIGVDEEYNYDC